MSEFNHSHPVHADTARADVSQSELAAPHNMPVDFAPFQLPLPVAFIWGAFLLDGVITAKLPDQPAEHSVLSVWRGGLDDLINFNTEVLDQAAVTAAIKAEFGGREGVELDELDGLTVTGDTWWFNVRPSNTEPLLRLNVEADDESQMTRLRDEVLTMMRSGGSHA